MKTSLHIVFAACACCALVLLVGAAEGRAAAGASSAPTVDERRKEDVGGGGDEWPAVAAPAGDKADADGVARLLDWALFAHLMTTADLRHEDLRAASAEDIATQTLTLQAHAALALSARLHFRAGARLRLHLSWRATDDDALHRSDFELLPVDSYLGWQRGAFELRVGLQTVVWGLSDLVNPLDMLAPRDLRLGLLTEPEATRLPSLGALLRGRRGDNALTFYWAPIFTPHRVDLFGSDFSVLGPGAPVALRPLGVALERALDDTVEGELQRAIVQTRLPRPLEGSDVGLRFDRSVRGWDLALLYVFTHQRLPALSLQQRMLPALAALAAAGVNADASALAPILAALLDADGGIEQRFARQHVIGASSAAAIGRFVATIDVAYRSRQREPLAGGGALGLPLVAGEGGWLHATTDSRALAYTVGLRHSAGEELLLVLEWWHELLLDELAKDETERLPLLLGGPQRGGIAALMRFRRGALTGQLLLHSEVFSGSLVASPEASYRFGEHLVVGGGVNVFVGLRGAGALYEPNDQAYVFLRADL